MELLVSVRSAAEAEAALAGGAAVIDVKEPARGALGYPEPATVAAVLATVAGRRPVSAALGELKKGNPKSQIPNPKSQIPNPKFDTWATDETKVKHGSDSKITVNSPCSSLAQVSDLGFGIWDFPPDLSFVKWGLAGCSGTPWDKHLEGANLFLGQMAPKCTAVAAVYADWQRAGSPSPEEVCHFLCERHWKVFLVDTWEKDGTTLLDWLSLKTLQKLCETCRRHGIRVALAGSLGEKQIRRLGFLKPDWFAVRGAACRQGRRRNSIDPGAVRRLVEVIESGRMKDEG